jgi:hypothetical protein
LLSDDKPQVSVQGRRRIAVSLVGLAAVPVVLLAACGNAEHKISQDNGPDARASTVGVQSALPAPVPTDSQLNSPPFNQVPPENLVSQQGFGERDN